MSGTIEKIAERIIDSHRIVVFVGAGLSTESGIPDFRSPGGAWDKSDPQIFSFRTAMHVTYLACHKRYDQDTVQTIRVQIQMC